MKPNELRKKSVEELVNHKIDLSKELFNLKFQLYTGRLENSSKLKNLKKDIARVNTILTERGNV